MPFPVEYYIIKNRKKIGRNVNYKSEILICYNSATALQDTADKGLKCAGVN